MGIQSATKPNRQWSVYVLRDPRNLDIRYVGVTHRLKTRLFDHIQQARRKDPTYRSNWIRSLLAGGLRPLVEIVEQGFGEAWKEAERTWIRHYRNTGARLTNLTDGGEGTPGVVRSEEYRKKISLRQKGRPANPEAIAKAAAKLRGRKLSAEHIEKIRLALKGNIVRTPEFCAQISARQIGRKPSAETREKQAAAKLGKKRGPYSPEHCQNISKALTGKKRGPMSLEQRQAHSIALKGRKWSDARRAAHPHKYNVAAT